MTSQPRGSTKQNTRQTRRQNSTEAAVSDGIMAFQHDFIGRGPDRIRTYITGDMVVVRSCGVLTTAEKHLVSSEEGRGTVKALRCQIVEAGRGKLESIIHAATKIPVVSIHSDISTKTGEWLCVFVLEREFRDGNEEAGDAR